jgi:putative tryptophan/tyrosine transport system substrate-binding protein
MRHGGRRRWSMACIAAIALSLSPPEFASAQTPGKAHRVGWLGNGNPPTGADRAAGDFQQGLRDVGYVEGRSFAVEYRYAGGNPDRLAEHAAELVRMPVDIIVTSGEPAAYAAMRATKVIPIVTTDIGVDPVKAGFVASLGRPGGNVTGMTTLSDDLWQKRLGLLREVAPKVSRLAVLWNPANSGNTNCVEELKAAAPAMRLQLLHLEVRDAVALDRALAGMAKEPPDALVTCWDSVTLQHARTIADFALKYRLPTLAPLKEYVEAGGLLSFGTSLPSQRRRASHYVDKILKGAKPADLPVERPTLFELAVNLKTAKALGLAVPTGLLVLADDLID